MSKKAKSDMINSENKDKAISEAEFVIAKNTIAKYEAKLLIANAEKSKHAVELAFANQEKGNRAAELVIANADKAKRAAELVIANAEKAKRAAELVIANIQKGHREDELIIADKEIIFQNEEKLKLASLLVIADVNKTKREAELVIANIEKTKLIAKIIIAEAELSFQKKKESNYAAKLVIADAEKAKRSAEIVIANIEKARRAAKLVIDNIEKAKRSAEIVIAKKEFVYQKSEKSKREAGLVIAKILKAKRSAELVIANIEKTKRAAEFVIVSKELVLSHEKGKLIEELKTVNEELRNEVEKRMQSEETLKNSFDFNETLLKTIPFGMDIVDEKGTILFQSDNFKKIFGESAIGRKCWELYRDENNQCSDCPLLTGISVGETNTYESHGVNGDRIFDISHTGMLYQGKKAMLEIFQDITERKQAESLLKVSDQKTMSIMENSADAIFITNQQGKYIYTNKAVSSMSGYTSEEMQRMTIADISPLHKIEEHIKFFKQILTTGKGFTETELLKKDGNYISVDLNAAILPDGTIYGSCRDITERKKNESELIKAKEKAEESDRLKSAFLANMSHEIRTPMNGILGFAELLETPDLTSDEQQGYIQIIQISGARLLNTINSIVDLSKIESGLIDVDIQEMNLNEKIEFTYNFFKPEAETKGLQFIVKKGLSDKDAVIKTDNEKVFVVMSNLVKNAIKFTYDGSIEFGYEKKGEYFEFFVKDTGIGIPNKLQQLVFQRFRQGSESFNRGYEGSGLGLSICKSYVEMLGGRIWVESKEGLGSIFYFTIPFNTVLEETSAIAENNEVQVKKLKILIVEDDEISYSLLTRLVQKISKEILHAGTGIEAVEVCRNNPDLDLILMDIRMPEMNGLEATQKIRQFNKDVIIIAQTAYGFPSDSKKALDAGCNDYIKKPVDKNLLFESIKKHVSK